MYLIFRCDCGRALYAKEGTREEASEAVQEMQDKIYGNTGFMKASELK